LDLFCDLVYPHEVKARHATVIGMSTPKELWPQAKGLVYSVDWIQSDRGPGFYKVVYSYEVAQERYTGSFYDFGKEDESYLHKDDSIAIRYDPAKPEHSEYPGARPQKYVLPNSALMVLRILVGVIFLMMLLSALRK
jgi:hypothetical protein